MTNKHFNTFIYIIYAYLVFIQYWISLCPSSAYILCGGFRDSFTISSVLHIFEIFSSFSSSNGIFKYSFNIFNCSWTSAASLIGFLHLVQTVFVLSWRTLSEVLHETHLKWHNLKKFSIIFVGRALSVFWTCDLKCTSVWHTGNA